MKVTMKSFLSICFLLIGILNIAISLFFMRHPFPIILGGALCLFFLIPLHYAFSRGSIETMQDGKITFSNKPLKFIFTLIILFTGYLFGILAPWVL